METAPVESRDWVFMEMKHIGLDNHSFCRSRSYRPTWVACSISVCSSRGLLHSMSQLKTIEVNALKSKRGSSVDPFGTATPVFRVRTTTGSPGQVRLVNNDHYFRERPATEPSSTVTGNRIDPKHMYSPDQKADSRTQTRDLQ